jgi:dinuclear metal center YbgI/SA1388 family protein
MELKNNLKKKEELNFKNTTMQLSEIVSAIEEAIPPGIQETFDNSGLIIGGLQREINSALVTIDVTEEVIDEAKQKNCQLIISHHPLIFSGLKKLTGSGCVERTVIKAVKNDIAIYSAHTNIDVITGGVNSKICEKIGLKNCRILKKKTGELMKLVTFIPISHADKVREAIFAAGAGKIGNYDNCGYNIEGTGTFRPLDNANPFTGDLKKVNFEKEIRFETIFPKYLKTDIIKALLKSHPYEEVAYDIYLLENEFNIVGMGMTGELESEMDEHDFLKELKKKFDSGIIRHTKYLNKKVKLIAVCGGSGISLLNDAISEKADVFVTSDVKYHDFFDADGKILLADIGHYESEQFTREVIFEILNKKLTNFAVYFSETKSNPINYL